MTHRVPEQRCVQCGHRLDAASHAFDDDPPPVPGDVSICVHCGHLRLYADDLTLRDATAAELDDLMRDGDLAGRIMAMRRALRAVP